MLENASLELLTERKNLLAFSGGVDSSALFFLLQKHHIKFDIAIVDYSTREQSKEEVAYAQKLAQEYNLIAHIHKAQKIEKNFESSARKIRYDFFESIIKNKNYDNLLTAHHLGDRFEWMLMQFCKGAGCAELTGMQTHEKRENYTLIRPLLHLNKTELYDYLAQNAILYFEDNSNKDESIKRNSFRHQFAQPLLEKYSDGIKKSFEYLSRDRVDLIREIVVQQTDELIYFKSSNHKRSDIYTIDKELKKLGYMPSAQERELLQEAKSLVVGRKYLVSFSEDFIFITPYTNEKSTMPHQFKEQCRVLKIEPKLRSFLYTHKVAFLKVQELFTRPQQELYLSL